MPPAPERKTLSPAELAKLEHAFATDPQSEAYKPLAEAYLGMGRFMEAMVVCKKGVKAHPTAADPRVLLARVYAEQGKDKKALDELQGALQVAPTDKLALRMAGALQMKNGEPEAGKANLLKAHQADPADAETLAALAQWKVEAPRPQAAEPPAAAAPLAGPGTRAPGARPHGGDGAAARPVPAHEPPLRPNGAEAHEEAVRQARPAPRSAPRPQARPRYVDEEAPISEVSEVSGSVSAYRQQRTRATKRKRFLTLLVLVPLALGAYWGYGRWKAIRNREIAKLLKEATEQLKHDSYDSYKRACEAADKVLEYEAGHTAAHGYLAYAYSIRWGEHGQGDDARKLAEEHLTQAKEGGDISSHLYAAEALYKTYSGKGADALKELEGRVKSFDSEGKKSGLMYLTLGIIQMNQGDLEHARESLDTAQSLAPDDPRVYSSLGTLYRRRGQDQDAWRNFDFALRYERDHPESTLGKALLILEQDDPARGYIQAAKMLKRLIESEPPPSPRQLATAHLARALLVSRLSNDLPLYTRPEGIQRELIEGTGVTLDKEKNKAEMNKAEETGFTLDRQNPELFLIKGKRLLYEENFEGSAGEIRKAIGLDASRAHYHVELARALMKKQGGEKEAEDALRRALTMIPESPKLQAMLGHALNRQGKTDEALAQYERAVRDPKARNPEARYSIGRIYKEKKEYPKAIDAFEKSAQEYIGQTWLVARSYDEAAQSYELRGDKVKAREGYEKALNADKDYDAAYCHYARFLSPEPKEKAKVKAFAQEYLKLAPKGECAADMQRFSR
ncbi:MAG: tetratricopeptide repeat protein [Myxococcales bacterium]|nr:tetratricopeptide repeat protein [Myxococcales bacterium]